MELHNRFTVDASPTTAFAVLRDIERIGPCMPGATIDEVDGDSFTGRVKVKIGPIQVTYRGEAEYLEVDEDALSATIKARGREARGAGTADATVRAVITDGPDGGSTVDVTTDLAITGKPAQFGRGVMADVAGKLIGQFADCLSSVLAGSGDAEDTDAAGSSEASDSVGGADTRDGADTKDGADSKDGADTRDVADTKDGAGNEDGTRPGAQAAGSMSTGRTGASRPPGKGTAAGGADAIDLLDVAGAPVAQRLAPVVLALVALVLLRRLIRRRR